MQAQGTFGQLLTLMEPSYKGTITALATAKARKLYLKSESFDFSQDLQSSALLRGGARQPTQPVRGNTDVKGTITTELNALSGMLHAACGDMDTTQSGGTFTTTAGTITTAVIAGQFLTVTFNAAHSLTGANIGDPLLFAGATGVWATAMNSKLYAIVDIPSTTSIILRVQAGLAAGTVTGTLTLNKYTSGTALYTHTIRAGGNLPSYLVEKGFTDVGQYFQYSGCKCGGISLNLAAAGFMDISSDWLGAGETTGISTMAASILDPGKASFDGLGITSANFKYGLASGSATTIACNIPKTLSLKLDNALDGDTYVIGGGGVRSAINAGVCKVTGQISGIFETLSAGGGNGYDLYANAKSGTPITLDIKAVRGTGDGSLGNETLQMVLKECLLKPNSPNIEGPGGVKLGFDFEAFVNTGTEALKFVVTNAAGPGVMI